MGLDAETDEDGFFASTLQEEERYVGAEVCVEAQVEAVIDSLENVGVGVPELLFNSKTETDPVVQSVP